MCHVANRLPGVHGRASLLWLMYLIDTLQLLVGAAQLNSTMQCRRKFADGFPNLFVKEAERIRNRHVGFLASFHNPSVIFEQISLIYALPRLFVSSFTLVLPFFPTGTLERVCCHVSCAGDCTAVLVHGAAPGNFDAQHGGLVAACRQLLQCTWGTTSTRADSVHTYVPCVCVQAQGRHRGCLAPCHCCSVGCSAAHEHDMATL